MPHILSVAEKLLSLKERFQIVDDSNAVVYDCTWHMAWIHARWVLNKGGREVASFRKRVWAIGSTWDVQSDMGSFVLRRKIFSFRRRISVQGGPLDGAEFSGGFFDLSFALTQHGTTLAKAHAKIMTLRERHVVEVLDDRPAVDLLTAILMTCLLVEKHAERNAAVAAAAAGAAGAAASDAD